jgi:hypothetical protein
MAKTLQQSMSMKLKYLAYSAVARGHQKGSSRESTNEAGRLLKTLGAKGAGFPEPQNVIEKQ